MTTPNAFNIIERRGPFNSELVNNVFRKVVGAKDTDLWIPPYRPDMDTYERFMAANFVGPMREKYEQEALNQQVSGIKSWLRQALENNGIIDKQKPGPLHTGTSFEKESEAVLTPAVLMKLARDLERKEAETLAKYAAVFHKENGSSMTKEAISAKWLHKAIKARRLRSFVWSLLGRAKGIKGKELNKFVKDRSRIGLDRFTKIFKDLLISAKREHKPLSESLKNDKRSFTKGLKEFFNAFSNDYKRINVSDPAFRFGYKGKANRNTSEQLAGIFSKLVNREKGAKLSDNLNLVRGKDEKFAPIVTSRYTNADPDIPGHVIVDEVGGPHAMHLSGLQELSGDPLMADVTGDPSAFYIASLFNKDIPKNLTRSAMQTAMDSRFGDEAGIAELHSILKDLPESSTLHDVTNAVANSVKPAGIPNLMGKFNKAMSLLPETVSAVTIPGHKQVAALYSGMGMKPFVGGMGLMGRRGGAAPSRRSVMSAFVDAYGESPLDVLMQTREADNASIIDTLRRDSSPLHFMSENLGIPGDPSLGRKYKKFYDAMQSEEVGKRVESSLEKATNELKDSTKYTRPINQITQDELNMIRPEIGVAYNILRKLPDKLSHKLFEKLHRAANSMMGPEGSLPPV